MPPEFANVDVLIGKQRGRDLLSLSLAVSGLVSLSNRRAQYRQSLSVWNSPAIGRPPCCMASSRFRIALTMPALLMSREGLLS